MRRILVDNARRKGSVQHGGHRRRVGLTDADPSAEAASENLLALDEALEKLAETDRPKAELVKLRYFGGLTLEQAAGVLGISRSRACENWAYARAWLRAEISKER
jgi:RNA polymerase sigma factor (TIGR02999 family)